MAIKVFTVVIVALALVGCSASMGQKDLSCPRYLLNQTSQHCAISDSLKDAVTLTLSLKNIKE